MKNLQKIFKNSPIEVTSEAEMVALGRSMAAELEPGQIFGLVGDLGAGKTHLVQGRLEGLGAGNPAASPTFSLVHEHDAGSLPVAHFDFYRLKSPLEALGFGWDDIQIAYIGPGHEKYEGKSVAQIAKEMGKSCLDAYLDLCEMSDFKGRVNMGPYSTPEIVSELSKDDRCLYMTDAWVEDNGIQNPAIYDCFPKFLKFSLCGTGDTMQNTIRKMTGAVADRFSIKERGYIKPSFYADLTVFNEKALRDGQPDQERPFGIEKVYINGIKVLDGDNLDSEAIKHTGRAMR